MVKNNFGVGFITCDRDPNIFERSYKSLINNVDSKSRVCVVNDGAPIEGVECINTIGKQGVGIAKNTAIKELLNKGYEHIFLMEDDVEIVDEGVFNAYINAYHMTGIKHFNFGLHGNHNNKSRRFAFKYKDNYKIHIYPELLGAFSYYHKDVFEAVGLMDERYYNALEHVDHTLRIIKAKMHPPFRYFADIYHSEDFIKDILPDHQKSIIRQDREEWMNTFKKASDLFNKIHGFTIANHITPGKLEIIATTEEVSKCLLEIYDSK